MLYYLGLFAVDILEIEFWVLASPAIWCGCVDLER